MSDPKRTLYEATDYATHVHKETQPLKALSEQKYDPEDLLTPKQFAKLAGTTETALAAEHKKGYFRAAYGDPQGGRGKERRYTVQQLFLYRSRKSKIEILDDYSGAQAQQCFRAFSSGKNERHCTEEFGIHPKIVARIHEHWAMCDDGIYISKEQVESIRAMPLDGPAKLETGQHIVEMLAAASEDALCAECSKRARKVCVGCANKRRRTAPSQT